MKNNIEVDGVQASCAVSCEHFSKGFKITLLVAAVFYLGRTYCPAGNCQCHAVSGDAQRRYFLILLGLVVSECTYRIVKHVFTLMRLIKTMLNDHRGFRKCSNSHVNMFIKGFQEHSSGDCQVLS